MNERSEMFEIELGKARVFFNWVNVPLKYERYILFKKKAN